MVQVAHIEAQPPETTHDTSTGISHNKLMMWAFLASDCMFFGSLIMTYMVYRGHAKGGPTPQSLWNIPYTSVSAAELLLSSLAIVLALTYLHRGNERAFRTWLLATAGLGLLFLGGQFYEFTTFYHRGLTLHSSLFGSTFFVLTGFHGTHVGIGVIWLLSLWVLSKRGKIPPSRGEMPEIVALYWHFVDIVWIIIFAVVYLIPYKP